MPSPQSIRIRSAPRRTSSAGSPRRALGTDPAVPANITESSIAAERSARTWGRHAVAPRSARAGHNPSASRHVRPAVQPRQRRSRDPRGWSPPWERPSSSPPGPDGYPQATLLPILWRDGVVLAHMARANPHWKADRRRRAGPARLRRPPGLRLAVVVREQGRARQGRPDLELLERPPPRPRACPRRRGVAAPPGRPPSPTTTRTTRAHPWHVDRRPRPSSSRSSCAASSGSRSRSSASRPRPSSARTARPRIADGVIEGLDRERLPGRSRRRRRDARGDGTRALSTTLASCGAPRTRCGAHRPVRSTTRP